MNGKNKTLPVGTQMKINEKLLLLYEISVLPVSIA